MINLIESSTTFYFRTKLIKDWVKNPGHMSFIRESTAHVQIYAKTGMQGCAKNNKMDRMFS